MKSLAFPAISCGVFGYPPEQAALIAVRECRQALEDLPALRRVVLVAFDERMAATYRSALADGASIR